MQGIKPPTRLPRPTPRALLLALLCAINLMWGSSWVVSKAALAEMSPLQLGGWRMIAAGLLLLPWLVAGLRRGELAPRHLPELALLGFLAFGAAKALTYWGLNLSTGLNASLLMALEPLLTVALARLWLREALTPRKLWALALGGGGAYLVIARGLRLPDFSASGVVGDLLFILGLGLEALYSVWGKAALRRHSALTVTSATIVAAGLFWIPVVVLDGMSNGWPTPGWTAVGAVLFLSLGCTVVAYMAWLFALKTMEAGTAGMTLLLQPLFGAALAAALLGDTLPPAAAAGGALVVFSLFLIVRRQEP